MEESTVIANEILANKDAVVLSEVVDTMITDYKATPAWLRYESVKAKLGEVKQAYEAMAADVYELRKDELIPQLMELGLAYDRAIAEESKAFDAYCESAKTALQVVSEPELQKAA